MKHFLSAVLLFLVIIPGTLFAWTYERVQIGDLYYNLNAGSYTAEVTYKSYSSKNNYNYNWNIDTAIIPESVNYRGNDYTVIGIGENAFLWCRFLTSISLPSTITFIGDNCFWHCTNLVNIIIPDNVTKIGEYAFSDCERLTSISIPKGVTFIGGFCFHNCTNLSSITIPDNITYINNFTFYNCRSLTTINIPSSVTTIGEYAFSNCVSLSDVDFPYGVVEIEGGAFKGCKDLISITIPSTIQSVEYEAFANCENLREVNYLSGVDRKKVNIPISAKWKIRNSQQSQQDKKSELPPLLSLIDGSLLFVDATGNNKIDANEQCAIKFKIKNNGKGIARNCEVKIKIMENKNGVIVESTYLPMIAVGQTYEVNLPVFSNIYTQDGKVTFSIEVYEPNGWGIAPFDLTVATKAYDPPFLQVVDYNIASNSGKIRKMEPFTLTFNLQNTKYGDAEDVKVKVNLPNNVFVMDGSAELSYPLIKSGEVKRIQLTLAANNNYPTTNIPITIDVKEKHGKFAENKHLDIALNQTTKSSISIAAKEDTQEERKEIQLALMKSDVDRNIPIASTKNSNTFVLILANEHYQQVATVPFALNDGNIFREYCIKTLGISDKHIKHLFDATGNQLKAGINWLANLTEAFDNPQIIVYYAGHGIPDESSKTAYLLPVDGIISDMSTCYKLDDLYATLGNMPASQITVFMDACFSGSKREEGMLASARGVALKAKSGTPQGNMVVFSAAQGNETAYPNKEKQHGLFTYYLLKKLQQTEGDVSLQELGDYIITNVKQQSILLNSKLQTPCVTPSASLDASWQNWKLK